MRTPVSVLRGRLKQQFLDVARVGSPARHIENPVAAVLVATELDSDRPIGIVELGLFSRRKIPIADNVPVDWDRVEDSAPLPLEIEPGGRPDLPIAVQQSLALERRQ